MWGICRLNDVIIIDIIKENKGGSIPPIDVAYNGNN